MKMKKMIIIGLVAALGMAACKTKELLPSEYVQWMKDPGNGLYEEKEIDDYTFSLQYKTSEFVILQQHKTDDIRQSEVDGQLKNYSGMEYYTFEIKPNDGHDLLDDNWYDAEIISSRIEYLLSYAQDDFSMVTGVGDTIACGLYHFERNYSLKPVTTIVLGFEKPAASSGDRTIVFNDQLLGSGPVLITIAESDILNVPAIKYAQHE